MGLRKFLEDAKAAQELTGQFAKTGDSLRLQEAEKEFQSRLGTQLPQAMQGDEQALSQLAQAGFAAGQPAPFNFAMNIGQLRAKAEAEKAGSLGEVGDMKSAALLALKKMEASPETISAVEKMTDAKAIKALVDMEQTSVEQARKDKDSALRDQKWQKGLSLKESEMILKTQKDIEKSDQFKDAFKQFTSGRKLEKILKEGGKLEANVVPFLTARLIQGAGVITDQDRNAFANAGGVQAWFEANKTKLEKGELPPEMKATFSRLAKAIMEDGKSSASVFIDSKIENASALGMNKDNLKRGLDINALMPAEDDLQKYRDKNADKQKRELLGEVQSMDNNSLLSNVRKMDEKTGALFDAYLKKNPDSVKDPEFRKRLEHSYLKAKGVVK
jgi:hypothetical protein